MSTSVLHVERVDDGVVLLTVDDPATRNALSGNTAIAEIIDACERLGTDPEVRAVIVTGRDPAFSAGGNLAALRSLWRPALEAATVRRRLRDDLQGLGLALQALEVPLIAAVNGPAMGGGCDLACLCDIRIASTRARFSANFVKLGMVPALGGAWLLPRIVGPARAAQMCLTGEMLDAPAALAAGLVSQVVEHDALMDTALALARQIAALPTDAVRMTKRLLRASEGSFAAHLETAAAMQALALHTAAHEAALERPLSQRPPETTAR